MLHKKCSHFSVRLWVTMRALSSHCLCSHWPRHEEKSHPNIFSGFFTDITIMFVLTSRYFGTKQQPSTAAAFYCIFMWHKFSQSVVDRT